VAVGALLTATQAPAAGNAQSSDSAQAVADANRASAAAIARQNAEIAAQQQQQASDANLTEKQKRDRVKAAGRAAKERAKAEERERKATEQKASGRTGSSRTAKAIGGCVAGALVGGLLGALLGGKGNKGSSILAGAAAGCGVGAALGLSHKDEGELNHYVSNDFALRDDVQEDNFYASESQKNVALKKSETTFENAQHRFTVPAGVDFDPANIVVNERLMRATGPVHMRGSPGANAVVLGDYGPNDRFLTYGTTRDGAWTYVVDDADGRYTLLGYVASPYVTTNLQLPAAQHVARAAPKPIPVKPARGRGAARSGPTALASTQSSAPRVATYTASTACKSSILSAGGASQNMKSCSGARSVAFNLNPTVKKVMA